MITPSASLIFLSPIECVRKGKKNGIVKEKEKKKKKERKKVVICVKMSVVSTAKKCTSSYYQPLQKNCLYI